MLIKNPAPVLHVDFSLCSKPCQALCKENAEVYREVKWWYFASVWWVWSWSCSRRGWGASCSFVKNDYFIVAWLIFSIFGWMHVASCFPKTWFSVTTVFTCNQGWIMSIFTTLQQIKLRSCGVCPHWVPLGWWGCAFPVLQRVPHPFPRCSQPHPRLPTRFVGQCKDKEGSEGL